MEESGQRIEELEAELASATQEVENYRATLESVQQELDNLRFENSRGQTRVLEGHDRRATLLRSNGDLTVVGVLQVLKGSPKTSSTSNPALQKSYDAALDFLMEQAVEDGEDNVQDRMMLIQTPTVMQVMTRVRMMMDTQVMTRVRMMMGIQMMIRGQMMLQTRVMLIVRSPFETTGISAWCFWSLSIQREFSHAKSTNLPCHLQLGRSDPWT
jgi:hypothetical protein